MRHDSLKLTNNLSILDNELASDNVPTWVLKALSGWSGRRLRGTRGALTESTNLIFNKFC